MESSNRTIKRVATACITAAGLFSVFLLIYSIVRHKYAVNVMYSVLPAALTALFFSSLRWKEPYRVNFALLVFVTGTVVYAGEIVVGYAELYRNHHSFIRRKYEKLDLIERFRAQGKTVYPIFSSSELLSRRQTLDGCVPLGGIANATTILGNESGTWILYESDEHGFNNPPGIWDSDSVDVVSVGDSFVHGLAVEPGKDISSHIRKRYPATLNIGYAGNGPLRELAALGEYGTRVRPRFVLWFYYENDLTDLRNPENGSLFHRYLDPDFSQRLMEKQAFIDSALSYIVEQSLRWELDARKCGGGVHTCAVHKVLKERSLFSIIALKALRRRIRFMFPESADLTGELAQFGVVLAEARKCVEAWGGSLVFVYLPGKNRYSNHQQGDRFREGVLALVKDLDVPCIDIHGVFSAQPDPLSLFPDRPVVHYNARGYELVADAVLAYIRTESQTASPRRIE